MQESELRRELGALLEASTHQPLDLVHMSLTHDGPATVVVGQVLTERQARGVRDIARRHSVEARLTVVADPRAGLEQGWLQLAQGTLTLWRAPDRIGFDHDRTTEYLAEDGPVRLIGTSGRASLVQGRDLTLGWTDDPGLQEVESSYGHHAWSRWIRPVVGAAVAPDPAKGQRPPPQPGQVVQAREVVLTGQLLDTARMTLGTPYRWGGTTPDGYDCSGLVQRVLSSTIGVLLPKHTSEQRRVGLRVLPEEVRAGDLLFATPTGQKVGHVMLLTSPESVLHACRTTVKVIEESLEENAERYTHQGFRRPVELAAR